MVSLDLYFCIALCAISMLCTGVNDTPHTCGSQLPVAWLLLLGTTRYSGTPRPMALALCSGSLAAPIKLIALTAEYTISTRRLASLPSGDPRTGQFQSAFQLRSARGTESLGTDSGLPQRRRPMRLSRRLDRLTPSSWFVRARVRLIDCSLL